MATHNGANDYPRQAAIFDQIHELATLVADQNAFVRGLQVVMKVLQPPGTVPVVNRDIIMCALVRKALTSHAAIRVLADAGHSADAKVVCRTLLENTVLLEWMAREPVFRMELYGVSLDLFRRRWAKVLETHYKDDPDVLKRAADHRAAAAAVAELFGDTEHRWAKRLNPTGDALTTEEVSIKEMFVEAANPPGTSPKSAKQSYVQDTHYFEFSAFVHSLAPSIVALAKICSGERRFAVGSSPDSADVARVLEIANGAALVAVSRIDQYAGLGLERQIRHVLDRLKDDAIPMTTLPRD